MTRFEKSSAWFWVGLLLVWGCSCAVALRLGAVSDLDLDSILALRLPRVVLATAVGAGLSLAGLVLQALFSNPLCEPYTLGISSVAALGAVVGTTLGLDTNPSGLVLPAFLGALVGAGALLSVSKRTRAVGDGVTTLLLSGVMLGLVASSLVAVWMAFADPAGISGALHWMLGELSRARLRGALTVGISVVALGTFIFSQRTALDAFLLGREGAQGVGVEVLRVERRLLLASCFLVGVCVSAAGAIGFVGLVIPHVARALSGSLHGRLIPLSALLGAITVVLGDLVGRSVFAPVELPVGVVTALVGAPVFLVILLDFGRKRARR